MFAININGVILCINQSNKIIFYRIDFNGTNLEQAAKIITRVDSPAVKVMMDLFHMQLEEPDYIRSIRQYQDCSIHVHLADSDRQYPGHGQLPFDEIIKIFSELGYQGAFTAEILQLPDQRSAAENTMRHMAPIFSQHYGRP